MKTKIVACETIRHELEYVMEKTGVEAEIIWLESGLHAVPKKLHGKLQDTIDSIEDADTVLLAMGYCGNSMADIKAGDFTMILPKAEDCITLFLGNAGHRLELTKKYKAIYMTRGWMLGEANMRSEYETMKKKYGQEMAEEFINSMYAHYETLGLIDMGVDDMNELIEDTKEVSELIGLKQRILPGTLSFLEKLLTGPWEEDQFIIRGPGEAIVMNDLLEYF